MAQFPWQKANVIEPAYNDDDGMFRGHEEPEDLSGKMTMDEARHFDRQNERHIEQFVRSIRDLPLHYSRK